jgi:amidase
MYEMTRRGFVGNSLVVSAAAAAPALVLGKSGGLSYEDYRGYDGLGLAELVRNKEASALELLELAIARSEQVNPSVNAVVEKLYDRARAIAARPLPAGPFAGVPFLLKDLGIALEGTVTTDGSVFNKGWVRDYTSTLAQRYQRAGLVIFGKTASPEFGGTGTTESTLFGATRNPWNLDHSSGGSSGGASAAVAAGILPVAHGSDGGGSIRIPSSCCGLFGLKPTRARTPVGPRTLATTNGMSVQHVLSRSVRDSAALLDVTHGPEPGSPYVAPKPARLYLEEIQRYPGKLRIAVVRTPITQTPVHADCLEALDNTARLCESLGHKLEETTLPVDPRQFFGATGTLMAAGTVARVQAREKVVGREVREGELEPLIWQRYQQARNISAQQFIAARNTVHQIGRKVALFMEDYDLVLTPTLAEPPARIGELSLARDRAGYERAAISVSAFTMLYNATGQPAMSVPLHWNKAGLPIGVMFAGRFGDESTLFRLAGQLELAQPWFDKLPPALT